MAKEFFDFDLEFKLGIEEIDNDHMNLINLLNQVQALLSEGKKDEARIFFSEMLSAYINEHFTREEKFMESIGFPGLEEHKQIHEKFRDSFKELAPSIALSDEAAFFKALSETYTWIILHIGKTDKKYVTYYVSKK